MSDTVMVIECQSCQSRFRLATSLFKDSRAIRVRCRKCGGYIVVQNPDLPVIIITPTSSDPGLTREGYTRFFRVNATDASQAPYDAEFMVNELNVPVPAEFLTRMQKADTADRARREGVAIAQEMVRNLKPLVAGVQLSAPFGRYDMAVQVAEALGPR